MTDKEPPVAKEVKGLLGMVYQKQIAEQLGIAPEALVWKSVSEREEKDADFGRVAVRAVRRKDWDDNKWHIFVAFGDDGRELDPGVYAESKQNAIKEIEKAIENLKKARAWIVNNVEGD